ncbi:TIGR04013 family B12-binding domain/radical SAM domain-containing protein [Methermicoccus shengliensis]|uniref:TIGR04013 family B12-binding domain/radical SAM domain-containing protein n=1 Tax=Methermicoccus shengliensis TaxID=660064 RepID=UPI00076BC7C8|nr:TIGR04013 family B12-binding domain/radical SAM domain-containing protein [Methermicoccus shengliensis]KUK29703.1 MAG: Fe-S oxidoreductase [Methanosarcinales archeaon 56_1174]MDI3488042.1 hypothetical protein [Methanosarcinales archaeon]MDN5295663.1 hypothetical protein [Methanosarcinales archaeon]
MIPVHFRYFRTCRFSIAALLPCVPNADIVREPQDGVMLYSFCTPLSRRVYAEVDAGRRKVDATWVAGGPHASARPREALEHFDYVVVGEGEKALPLLLDAIERGCEPEGVEGVAYVREGRMHHTPQRSTVCLDEYPPFDSRRLCGPIEITRGCPHACAYCQTPRLFGHTVRHRSIPSIVEAAGAYRDVRFISPNALGYGSDGVHPRLDKVEALLSAIHGKRVFFGTFPSEVRPEFVSERALALMDRYCANRSISIGVQSGSDLVLARLGRGHTVAQAYEAVERCLDADFTPTADFIFGLPIGDEEDERATLEMVEWIVRRGGRVRAHAFIPLPATPLEHASFKPPSQRTVRTLGRLARAGKLTGSWEPLSTFL